MGDGYHLDCCPASASVGEYTNSSKAATARSQSASGFGCERHSVPALTCAGPLGSLALLLSGTLARRAAQPRPCYTDRIPQS